MSFELTANKLTRASEIKALKLENEEYDVQIFYYGDYESDRKSGKCDVANLSMSCKPKKDGFAIALMSGKVFIDVLENRALPVTGIDDFKKQLDIAKEAAVELQGIVKEYFGIDPEYI